MPTKQKIIVSSHATFMEREFIQEGASGRTIELQEVNNLQINMDSPQEISHLKIPNEEVNPQHTSPLRRSKGVRHIPLRYGFIIGNDNEAIIIENDDPLTYSKALMSKNSNKWLEAKKSEMDSMITNQVWTLVDLPEDVTPIGCK